MSDITKLIDKYDKTGRLYEIICNFIPAYQMYPINLLKDSLILELENTLKGSKVTEFVKELYILLPDFKGSLKSKQKPNNLEIIQKLAKILNKKSTFELINNIDHQALADSEVRINNIFDGKYSDNSLVVCNFNIHFPVLYLFYEEYVVNIFKKYKNIVLFIQLPADCSLLPTKFITSYFKYVKDNTIIASNYNIDASLLESMFSDTKIGGKSQNRRKIQKKINNVDTQTNIHIREAQKSDIAELEKLFLLVCKKTFSKEAFERVNIKDFRSSIINEKTFIAQNDDIAVGFISSFTGDYSYIHNLFIHPDWQNKGIGKKLLKKALQGLKLPVELEVLKDNNKARIFFEKQGWKEISTHEDTLDPYIVYRYENHGKAWRKINDVDIFYDINELIESSKHIKSKMVSIENYLPMLDRDYWEITDKIKLELLTKSETNAVYITPNDVLLKPELSVEHTNRINNADLSYPILVTEDYDVLDGLHRLAKVYKMKHKEIKVKIIPIEILHKIGMKFNNGNRVLFVMFQGGGTPPTAWNEDKSKFLSRLEKIGNVYTYQNKLYNVFHYFTDGPDEFPADIDFDLSYLDMDKHLELVYNDINKNPNNKNLKLVPVGWSAGGYFALAFAQKYKQQCQCCILLDGVTYTDTHIKQRLNFLAEKGGSEILTNSSLKELQQNIIIHKKENDIFKLLTIGHYMFTKYVQNHLTSKLSIPTLSFINLEPVDVDQKAEETYMNNASKKAESKTLSETNSSTYKSIFFNDQNHKIFMNVDTASEIITEIDKFLIKYK